MKLRLGVVLLAAVVATVAAGCGGSGAAYKADSTAKCLTSKGFTGVTTEPAKVGFIAAFAANGGLLAVAPRGGNTVVIAFAANDGGVAATEQAYRQHAPKALRPHLGDIMSSQHNAVIVWTVTPSSNLQNIALACLRS